MRYLPHIELSYCTNVHAGEGAQALLQQVVHDLPQVKTLVSEKQAFGSGLRMGYETVCELRQNTQALNNLVTALQAEDLYVFSANGFPYGDFAAHSVKTKVYEPDWSTQARVDYTLELARLLTQLPGPQFRTISTVAGGFVADASQYHHKDQDYQTHFARLSQGLYQIEEETGVTIRVAFEPEPWTRLERIDQVIPFFEDLVWPSSAHAKRYLGLCYDTCHQALAFEKPKQTIQHLVKHEIPIYKVQISNALSLTQPQQESARAQLLSFSEPRYLHQVTALTSEGKLLRALDLPQLIEAPREWLNALEWRCHFHVPIWWKGATLDENHQSNHLGTTYEHWSEVAELICDPELQHHTAQGESLHVEIETYSWHVLPEQLKSTQGLHYEIKKEFQALFEKLNPPLNSI